MIPINENTFNSLLKELTFLKTLLIMAVTGIIYILIIPFIKDGSFAELVGQSLVPVIGIPFIAFGLSGLIHLFTILFKRKVSWQSFYHLAIMINLTLIGISAISNIYFEIRS